MGGRSDRAEHWAPLHTTRPPCPRQGARSCQDADVGKIAHVALGTRGVPPRKEKLGLLLIKHAANTTGIFKSWAQGSQGNMPTADRADPFSRNGRMAGDPPPGLLVPGLYLCSGGGMDLHGDEADGVK